MKYTIKNDDLHVKIDSHGAEMQSLFSVTADAELLWQADKQHWARHAPILFPIIGKLKNDTLKTHKQTYPMSQHGFARDSEFALVDQTESSITLSLKDTAETLKKFPFAFELRVTYRLKGACLECHFTVSNPSTNTLPFSIGGHPAFNWPLLTDVPKEQHRIRFDKKESGEISLLDAGLICRDDLTSPVKNQALDLKEGLFEDDALIFKNVKSQAIYYEAIKNDHAIRSIEVVFSDFNDLGIWTKPGADFICLEPWLGYSSSVNFDDDFSKKAGLVHLKEKTNKDFCFTIKVAV